MRSPVLARLYFQCAPDEDIDKCRTTRSGRSAFAARRRAQAGEGKDSAEGRHADAQAFVTEPMQYGRLYLARRQRAHRAADRRQGNEPPRRRAHAVGSAIAEILQMARREVRRLLASRVARSGRDTVLLVDDVAAASLSVTRTPSTGGGRSPNLNICQFARRRDAWRRTIPGCHRLVL